MNLIVAVDNNWAIGNKGDLLARVRADLKYFASKTTGNVVILGSKTLATFPGGRPLKNRTNIIMSTRDITVDGAQVVHSVDELMETVKQYPSESVYVIGGASIYNQLLPYCERAYITKFDSSFEYDTAIPNLDESDEWKCVEEGPWQVCDPETDSVPDMRFMFTTYERVK